MLKGRKRKNEKPDRAEPREILFRGRSIEDGTWCEGDYTVLWRAPHIVQKNQEVVRVEPSTVGQYTGFRDKDGRRIFEWDICEAHYDEVFPDEASITFIKFDGGAFCVCYLRGNGILCDCAIDEYYAAQNKVIGNMFDTPTKFYLQGR